MNKLGQLTLETLLWYGAALLVVLLAIGALVSFGVLDLGNMLPEKCNFKGSASLSCEDYKIDYDDDRVQLQLANKGTKSVQINSADFVASDTGLASGCNTLSGGSANIQPGQSQLVTIDCSGGGIDANSGVRVTGEVELKHTLGGGSIEHIAVGKISARATQ